MICGVPNFAIALGYTNASWTLKCDLMSHYVCRLLNHMDAHGYAIATPQPPGPSLPTEPFLDFNSGYVLRVDRQAAEAGRHLALAPPPELVPRRAAAEARPGGRLDGVLGPGAASVSRCGRPRRTPPRRPCSARRSSACTVKRRAVPVGAARPRSARAAGRDRRRESCRCPATPRRRSGRAPSRARRRCARTRTCPRCRAKKLAVAAARRKRSALRSPRRSATGSGATAAARTSRRTCHRARAGAGRAASATWFVTPAGHDHRHALRLAPEPVVVAVRALPAPRRAPPGWRRPCCGRAVSSRPGGPRSRTLRPASAWCAGSPARRASTPPTTRSPRKPEARREERVPLAVVAHDRSEVAAPEHHARLRAHQRALVPQRAGPADVAEAEPPRRLGRVRSAPQDALDFDGHLPADQARVALGSAGRRRDRLLHAAHDRHRVRERAQVVEGVGRVVTRPSMQT